MTDLEQQARAIAQQVVPYDGHGSVSRQGQQQARTAAKKAAMLAFRAAQTGDPLLVARDDLQHVCDLLAERVAGSPARSASHNARVRLETLMSEALSRIHPDREAVARIIDPAQWRLHDAAIASANRLGGEPLGSVIAHDERERAASYVRGSLAKADAILALLPAEPVQEMREGLPRLTEAMMRAAAQAHYGWDNIDGLDLTAADVNYTFRDGFKRMWAGIRKQLQTRAAFSEPQEQGEEK